MPPALRGVFDTAKLSKGGSHASRLLALAAMHDGATRTQAAEIGSVRLQIWPSLGDFVCFRGKPGLWVVETAAGCSGRHRCGS